jgi:CheY-like chemotaxis protein
MSKPILVVEDHNDIRKTIVEILEFLGYDALPAEDGEAALQRLAATESVGLIILDLMMPGMSGWEFRARQMAHAKYSKIPVVIVSADVTVAPQAESLGVQEVLRKPVDFDAIKKLAEEFCGPPDRASRF